MSPAEVIGWAGARYDCHEVFPGLWVGADLPESHQRKQVKARDLVQKGITHVLDVRQECDDYDFYAGIDEITYDHVPGHDEGDEEAHPPEWWHECLAVADRAYDADGTLLVHCHMGVNRAPSVAVVILMDQYGLSPVDAIEAVRQGRPVASCLYAPEGVRWFINHERTRAVVENRPPGWTVRDIRLMEEHVEKTFDREKMHENIRGYRKVERHWYR